MTDLAHIAVWAPTLLLVTLRVAGMVLVAPVFGHSAVPLQVRLGMAAVMALAAAGAMAGPIAAPANLWLLAGAGACELGIGAAVGYLASLIFAGVELGAFHISNQMGLSLADVIDPTNPDVPSALRGLFVLLAIVIFLGVGGHRALIGGLMASFETVPPMGFVEPGSLIQPVVAMLGAAFVLALKLAGPVLIAMLLATAAIGLVQRTLPTLGLLSIGLPLMPLLGLAIMSASLMAVLPLTEAAATYLQKNIIALTGAAR
jgi:flagellar biosynthetic protein FliR